MNTAFSRRDAAEVVRSVTSRCAVRARRGQLVRMRKISWLLGFLGLAACSAGGNGTDPALTAPASDSNGVASDPAVVGPAADGTAPFPAGTICNDTGVPRLAPAVLKHVIVVLFENEDLGSVNGNAKAPYLSSLATSCGYATQYLDNTFTSNLVSLPHYLALASGTNCDTGMDQSGTNCITDNGDATTHQIGVRSIFDQVSWRSYQEGMPSACALKSGGDGYAAKHNPAAYYSALASCDANDLPIAPVKCSGGTKLSKCSAPSNAFTADLANDTLAAYTLVTPNLANDMHDGTVTQADNWLYTYLPLVFQSPSYRHGETAVMIVFDEQSTSDFGGSMPNVFISPFIAKGTVTAEPMNHFAVLRATEQALGVDEYLGCASGTRPGGGDCPVGSTTDLRGELGL